MTVVADTSVVLNLCAIGLENTLRQLFGRVLVPMQVAAEFQRLAEQDLRFKGLNFPGFIEIMAVDPPFSDVPQNPDLHLGESAAIQLALSVGASSILLDDRVACIVADELDLFFVGTLGILIEAKRVGHVGKILPFIEELEAKAGFWISMRVKARVLREAGE